MAKNIYDIISDVNKTWEPYLGMRNMYDFIDSYNMAEKFYYPHNISKIVDFQNSFGAGLHDGLLKSIRDLNTMSKQIKAYDNIFKGYLSEYQIPRIPSEFLNSITNNSLLRLNNEFSTLRNTFDFSQSIQASLMGVTAHTLSQAIQMEDWDYVEETNNQLEEVTTLALELKHLKEGQAALINKVDTLVAQLNKANSSGKANPIIAAIFNWIIMPLLMAIVYDVYVKQIFSPDKSEVHFNEINEKLNLPENIRIFKSKRKTEVSVNVRIRPARNSAKIGKIPKEQTVDVLMMRKKWILIFWEDSDGNPKMGWVYKKYFYPIDPSND